MRLIPASPCSYHVAAVIPEWRVRFLNHRGRLGAWAAPQIAPACTAPVYTWRASLLEAAPDMIQTEATMIVTPCTTPCWRPIAGALEELPPGSNCSFAWLAAALSAAAAIRYEAVEAQAEALERPYQGLAALLNCERDEVALLQSATAAWTQARPGPPCAAMPLGLRAL